jgi:hypothetical protein
MFYKIYKITNDDTLNDINILRFSYNPFIDMEFEEYSEDDDKINQLLENLKRNAENDILCYNHIYPWKDIRISNDIKNKEILIVYNNKTNHIQGWCNFNYSTFTSNDNPTNLYTLSIDKLVSRAIPKIKYIGLLLLEFIRDECVEKPIKYFHDNPRIKDKYNSYEDINIDIMYLYSLTTSINFYKKTFLTQLQLTDPTHINYEIFKHVFIYLKSQNIDKPTRKLKINLISLSLLHSFECNSVLCAKTIKIYNEFKPPKTCNNDNQPLNSLITLTNIDYDIKIDKRIFSPRKRSFEGSSYTSQKHKKNN